MNRNRAFNIVFLILVLFLISPLISHAPPAEIAFVESVGDNDAELQTLGADDFADVDDVSMKQLKLKSVTVVELFGNDTVFLPVLLWRPPMRDVTGLRLS